MIPGSSSRSSACGVWATSLTKTTTRYASARAVQSEDDCPVTDENLLRLFREHFEAGGSTASPRLIVAEEAAGS